jgi:WD40 repeat protein
MTARTAEALSTSKNIVQECIPTSKNFCLCLKVRLWNLQSGTCDVTLSGHKGQVTALKYNQQGGLLASGAQDTDIIVWDVAAESGLYRLRGHQDQVTDLVCCTDTCGVACSFMHICVVADCMPHSTQQCNRFRQQQL